MASTASMISMVYFALNQRQRRQRKIMGLWGCAADAQPKKQPKSKWNNAFLFLLFFLVYLKSLQAIAKSFSTQRFAYATSYFIWQIGRFKFFQFLRIINCQCSTNVFKVDCNQGTATIFPKFISYIRVGNHKWKSLLFFIFEKISIVIFIYKKRFTWLNEVNSIVHYLHTVISLGSKAKITLLNKDSLHRLELLE